MIGNNLETIYYILKFFKKDKENKAYKRKISKKTKYTYTTVSLYFLKLEKAGFIKKFKKNKKQLIKYYKLTIEGKELLEILKKYFYSLEEYKKP